MADRQEIFQAAAEFRSALGRFARSTEEICQAHGLTADQYTLLVMVKGAINGTETTTVTELSEKLKLSRNGIAERVRRAELNGLIKKARASHDRRVSYLSLTARGEQLLSETFADLGQESSDLMRLISDVERRVRQMEQAD